MTPHELELAAQTCTHAEFEIISHCHAHPNLTWTERSFELNTPETTLKSRYRSAWRKITNHPNYHP